MLARGRDELFRNYRKDGINAIILEEGKELIGVRLTTGSDDVAWLDVSEEFDPLPA